MGICCMWREDKKFICWEGNNLDIFNRKCLLSKVAPFKHHTVSRPRAAHCPEFPIVGSSAASLQQSQVKWFIQRGPQRDLRC